ncbi:MAG TPA: DUF503 domain-containing protein [Candidatus Eisenbacteria bacterium]|jgi:uncharacterized protein|nr:DUF503 domain-containing protein [Candidatus Eisenbacteria bacterium]HEU4940942.1 DUF503 domain-containing protein [Candidatus Eisenbacteria bacterium]HEX5030828.1 DUF503 domain-containing protein [Candidatus Eisenbacteria bacterium]
MRVGTLEVDLHLPASDSLKAKRSILNHVKDRVRSRFNAAVAEVGPLDLWQRASLGVAVVGAEPVLLERVLRDVLAAIEREDRLAVLDYHIQVD